MMRSDRPSFSLSALPSLSAELGGGQAETRRECWMWRAAEVACGVEDGNSREARVWRRAALPADRLLSSGLRRDVIPYLVSLLCPDFNCESTTSKSSQLAFYMDPESCLFVWTIYVQWLNGNGYLFCFLLSLYPSSLQCNFTACFALVTHVCDK